MSDLETDREAVKPCQFEPIKTDHYGQEHGQETATLEAKKYSTIEAGGSLHGVAPIPPSTTETSLQHTKHKLYLPDVRVCYICAIDMPTSRESLLLL